MTADPNRVQPPATGPTPARRLPLSRSAVLVVVLLGFAALLYAMTLVRLAG